MTMSNPPVSAGQIKTPIRVEINPKLPLDPLNIQTMSDYDLALCLYRTWFEFDAGRKAIPGIVESWAFDGKTGKYSFSISSRAKWSDGTDISSEHLIQNLHRAKDLKSSFGEAISGIVDLGSAKVLSAKKFEIQTKNKQPSESLFQRLGSIFLAPIHPSDWNASSTVTGNNRVSGPYAVSKIAAAGLELVRNENDFLGSPQRVEKIEIRLNSETDLTSFLEGRSWATVMQTSSLLPFEAAEKLTALKLPYWTRGHDRASVLYPVGADAAQVQENRKILQAFGAKWHEKSKTKLPLNVAVARSLQPVGYPLRVELEFKPAQPKEKKTVRILARKSIQSDSQRPKIDEAFQKLGMAASWVFVASFQELLAARKSGKHDFALMNVGVADPEPTTWMGLIIKEDSMFADVEKGDIADFKAAARATSKTQEVELLRALLKRMGERGSYLPLFHYSTLSIGRPGLSFENVGELDETVDYSKLISK